jgi:NAD(P)-dependent dehydrogenase (short-subunit alcohol dehydrogenase family)
MAAKAGVKHFMRHAAYELAAYGIRVNAIAPGPFVTNIGDGWVKKNPAAKAAWDELVPVGRMAETTRSSRSRCCSPRTRAAT